MDALFRAELVLGGGAWRSMSVEKRTRWDTSDDRRDAVGRVVFPMAEVRDAGTFSVAR